MEEKDEMATDLPEVSLLTPVRKTGKFYRRPSS